MNRLRYSLAAAATGALLCGAAVGTATAQPVIGANPPSIAQICAATGQAELDALLKGVTQTDLVKAIQPLASVVVPNVDSPTANASVQLAAARKALNCDKLSDPSTPSTSIDKAKDEIKGFTCDPTLTSSAASGRLFDRYRAIVDGLSDLSAEQSGALSDAYFARIDELNNCAPDGTPTTTAPPTSTAPVVFENCDQVRAAGKAPLLATENGFRSSLDTDGDGIACEDQEGTGGSNAGTANDQVSVIPNGNGVDTGDGSTR